MNRCSECGSDFASLSAFDRHRIGRGGERRCLTWDEFQERGWRQDALGRWRMPVQTVRRLPLKFLPQAKQPQNDVALQTLSPTQPKDGVNP